MNAYRLLVEKLKGKRPLGRLKCMWVSSIKMNVDKMGWYGLE
jgi:hypothetical protein